ncbi:MAG: hypothetical protein R3Y38_06615 [Rikenellaceae bacterium]
MKKLFLSLLVAMFALQVAPVVANDAATNKGVTIINRQVGGTLTDEQKTQIAEIYSTPAEEGVSAKAANRAKVNKAIAVLTEEQKAARAEAIKAAAEAKK